MSAQTQNPLEGVQAFVFDVFGTVVNWRKGIFDQLEAKLGAAKPLDWDAFAEEWRKGYYKSTSSVASGGSGPLNVDQLHRQILEDMLSTDRWAHLAPHLDDAARHELVLFWHRLPGWPDSSAGLYGVKKFAIIGTLSNGSVRTLIDMAKYADLPWDLVLSSELLGSYKPNPKTYLGAVQHLSLTHPSQLCMVAAHMYDLRAAASHGLRTVFVRRPRELDCPPDVRAKTDGEGGEVDLVVDGLEEIARVLETREEERQVWQR
ncbi:HAD-like domain-containing protein [Fomitopsis serialis]|uniref:HAD-like domain-containing protein n=1 Tax=Fomitopsis serialis TaxID=139415 RepID=UPI002007DE37|nr:HAD-like domain-containing protein [Neoantrodia serialis]KAH9931344.1 HAD-like domain-containing protein [Neoantrodia serialis]